MLLVYPSAAGSTGGGGGGGGLVAPVENISLAEMAAYTLKGNATGSFAPPQDILVSANSFLARSSTGVLENKTVSDFALTLLDDTDAAAMRTTLGISGAGLLEDDGFGDIQFVATYAGQALKPITDGVELLGLETSQWGDVQTKALNGVTLTSQGLALLDDSTSGDQRTTLGLGDSATKNVGVTTGTVCAGDDSRLSDPRTPIGSTLDEGKIYIGDASNQVAAVTPIGDVTIASDGTTAIGAYKVQLGQLQKISSYKILGTLWYAGVGEVQTLSYTPAFLTLMDDADYATMRSTLELGNCSTLDIGTIAGTVCAGDDSRLSDVRSPIGTALTSGKIYVGDASNTAQEQTVSGDATLSNAGIFTIASDSVTYDKMQDTSVTDVLLGRSTAGGGTVEEISCTSAGRALIDDATTSAQRTTLGSTAIGDALFITASASAARSTLGATSLGDTLFTIGSVTLAQQALSLEIDVDVQAYDALLKSFSALTTEADQMFYTTDVDTVAVTSCTSWSRSFLGVGSSEAACSLLSVKQSVGYNLVNIEVYTSSGIYTKPKGITALLIDVVGGGGGGAGGTSTVGGGGGGAGGYARKFITGLVSDLPLVYTVTIGTGGAGGGANGSPGGATSFGGTVSATGGGGGSSSATTATGGSGGLGSGGDVNTYGGAGQEMYGAASSGSRPLGGASFFGGGGGRSVADTGLPPGSGGSGCFKVSSSGGAGADGVVIIYEFD